MAAELEALSKKETINLPNVSSPSLDPFLSLPTLPNTQINPEEDTSMITFPFFPVEPTSIKKEVESDLVQQVDPLILTSMNQDVKILFQEFSQNGRVSKFNLKKHQNTDISPSKCDIKTTEQNGTPSALAMVKSAIKGLGKKKGSTRKEITRYVTKNSQSNPEKISIASKVRIGLRLGVKNKVLRKIERSKKEDLYQIIPSINGDKFNLKERQTNCAVLKKYQKLVSCVFNHLLGKRTDQFLNLCNDAELNAKVFYVLDILSGLEVIYCPPDNEDRIVWSGVNLARIREIILGILREENKKPASPAWADFCQIIPSLVLSRKGSRVHLTSSKDDVKLSVSVLEKLGMVRVVLESPASYIWTGEDILTVWDDMQILKYSTRLVKLKRVEVSLPTINTSSNLNQIQKPMYNKSRGLWKPRSPSLRYCGQCRACQNPHWKIPCTLRTQRVLTNRGPTPRVPTNRGPTHRGPTHRSRVSRCRKCEHCLRLNCLQCKYCLIPSMKKACIQRQCPFMS